MKRSVSAILTVMFLLGCLAGCNKTIGDVLGAFGVNNGSEEGYIDGVKLNKETKYFNDYLGVSCAVPKGWWLYDVSEDNLSESKGDITDDVSMDIQFGMYESYTYSDVWLLNFGNLKNTSQDNHLGFTLDAIFLEGINDMAGYMKYFETYMLEPDDEAEYSMIDSRQITINGKSFEMRDYLVSREKNNFNVMTFTCQVKEGYFFNISADYWPENAKAKKTIINSITKSVGFF